MVCAPGCSAPCKAVSLNSLPFSGRLQPTSVETRPRNSSYQASEAATATMVTLSQVAPSPCVSLSITLLALSLPRVEAQTRECSLWAIFVCKPCLKNGEEEEEEF